MTHARVFDLPIHRASRWIFNCYVIEAEADQTVVVDPGLNSTAGAAVEIVRGLGRDQTEICAVSSHGHSDHVGGMPLLREQLHAASYLPGRCEDYLRGEEPRVFGTDSMLRFLPIFGQQPFSWRALYEFASGSRTIGFGTGGAFRFPFAPDGFLGSGQPPPGMHGWEIIETPGHSDDSTCFYHPDSATLLSGDAVVTLDGRAWFNPEWVDAAASQETEDRLRALPVRHLLPGHGLPLTGAVWDTALSFRDRPPPAGLLARCARRFGRW